MKRNIILLLFLCSFLQIHAEKNALSSQFLKLLTPSEPVVEKTPEKPKSKSQSIKKEPEVKNDDQDLDEFLQLLTITEKKSQKKLYKADLKTFDFKYITHLEYNEECEGFPKFDEKKLTKAEKELTKKYSKLIAKGYEAPWYLQYINEQIGHGAFADADIEEGDMVGEYTGIIIERKNSLDFDFSYGWTLLAPENSSNREDIFFVDAKKAGNFTRFINHSYYPNVKGITVYSNGEWHMVYVAIKPIKKGQQFLVDYGFGYWMVKTCKPVEFAFED